MERRKLTDILRNANDRDQLSRLWKTTTPAEEFAPLPVGEFQFRILSGVLINSKRGTPGYRWTLEVTEGEFEGRRAWADFWLTRDALPMTKRDLAKIGITDLNQLEQPLPPGILIRGRLAIRRDDDGYEGNRLVRFTCVGVEEGDAFAPTDHDEPGPSADTGIDAGWPTGGVNGVPRTLPNGGTAL